MNFPLYFTISKRALVAVILRSTLQRFPMFHGSNSFPYSNHWVSSEKMKISISYFMWKFCQRLLDTDQRCWHVDNGGDIIYNKIKSNFVEWYGNILFEERENTLIFCSNEYKEMGLCEIIAIVESNIRNFLIQYVHVYLSH